MSNILDLYRQYIGDPTAQAVGGFGRGMLGLEQPEYLQNELGREAYRTGQAVGNMPAVAAPVGALKAMTQAPELAGMLTSKASQFADALPALGVVIGSKSLNPRMAQMMKDIADMKQVRHIQPDIEKYIEKTYKGWREPVTKRYMMELDDSIANFKPNTDFTEAIDKGYLGKKKLGEIFDHPELFEAYPALKDVDVSFLGTRNSSKNIGGSQLRNDIEIYSTNLENARKTLLHEIQHFIQDTEGWPRGGSPDNMITGEAATKKLKEASKNLSFLDTTKEYNKDSIDFWSKREQTFKVLEKYPDTPEGRYQAYRDLWGERQAETVSDRANLSSALRGPGFQQEMVMGQPPTVPLSRDGFGAYSGPSERVPYLSPELQRNVGTIYPENPLGVPYRNVP